MTKEKIEVINLKGEREPFSSQKVYKSALRAGADEKTAKRIAEKIRKEAYDGMKTSKIFKKVNSFLSKEAPKAALRFNIKKAMRKLGPTGFAFEKYAGEIFLKHGFKVKYNQMVEGFCAEHEIDFTAQKGEKVIFAECKYRNRGGDKIDLPVALQNYARFLDIKKGKKIKNRQFQTLIVTNAKFTSKAVKYASCVKTELLGWKYPAKKGLENLIEGKNLYPITILPSFKKGLVEVFIEKRIMLAQDVLKIDPQSFSKKNDLPFKVLKSLKREADILLS